MAHLPDTLLYIARSSDSGVALGVGVFLASLVLWVYIFRIISQMLKDRFSKKK